MKKLVLVLFMFALCFSFLFIVSNRNPYLNRGGQNIDIPAELESDNAQIDENYPNSPKELIEIHNKIMSYLYSKKMQDEHIELYANVIRKLYSEELLSLNNKESQINTILAEKEENNIKMLKLLGSKTEEVIYSDNGNKAQVRVIYYINSGDMSRLYNLDNTPSGWKITSWQDSKIENDQLEESKDE